MVKSDTWIEQNAKRLGVNPEYINSNSVDAVLGGNIKAFRSRMNFEYVMFDEAYTGEWRLHTRSPKGVSYKYDTFMKEYNLSPGEAFHILPDTFYLMHTEEYVSIPLDKIAIVFLKSTPARKGVDHNLAVWHDSGFEGQTTLEVSSHILSTVVIGEPLVQFTFFDAEKPAADYSLRGHYQRQMGAQEAWK